MKDVNYDEILNSWYDKIIDKADKAMEKANSCEVGSANYFKYKCYAEGIYDVLAMLSLEERKAKRKRNNVDIMQ